MVEYMPPQQALTRPRNDPFHAVDDMRITSYALRYYVNPPEANCPNTYPVEPTSRIQKNGGGYVEGHWRTDVESDLKGINRLGQRVRAEDRLYNPETNYFNNQQYTSPTDGSFPMNFNRLYNPPCTLRATGWNRFDYLFHDPQSTFETPFDWFIPSRDVDKQKCKSSPYTPRHCGTVEAFVGENDQLKHQTYGQVVSQSPSRVSQSPTAQQKKRA